MIDFNILSRIRQKKLIVTHQKEEDEKPEDFIPLGEGCVHPNVLMNYKSNMVFHKNSSLKLANIVNILL